MNKVIGVFTQINKNYGKSYPIEVCNTSVCIIPNDWHPLDMYKLGWKELILENIIYDNYFSRYFSGIYENDFFKRNLNKDSDKTLNIVYNSLDMYLTKKQIELHGIARGKFEANLKNHCECYYVDHASMFDIGRPILGWEKSERLLKCNNLDNSIVKFLYESSKKGDIYRGYKVHLSKRRQLLAFGLANVFLMRHDSGNRGFYCPAFPKHKNPHYEVK